MVLFEAGARVIWTRTDIDGTEQRSGLCFVFDNNSNNNNLAKSLPYPRSTAFESTREVEEAAVKSLEAAERRRAEWEKKASAIAARLRERESEVGDWTPCYCFMLLCCLRSRCETVTLPPRSPPAEGNGHPIFHL